MPLWHLHWNIRHKRTTLNALCFHHVYFKNIAIASSLGTVQSKMEIESLVSVLHLGELVGRQEPTILVLKSEEPVVHWGNTWVHSIKQMAVHLFLFYSPFHLSCLPLSGVLLLLRGRTSTATPLVPLLPVTSFCEKYRLVAALIM